MTTDLIQITAEQLEPGSSVVRLHISTPAHTSIVNLNIDQAKELRDALIKAVYDVEDGKAE